MLVVNLLPVPPASPVAAMMAPWPATSLAPERRVKRRTAFMLTEEDAIFGF
jgi:hypothetical protein